MSQHYLQIQLFSFEVLKELIMTVQKYRLRLGELSLILYMSMVLSLTTPTIIMITIVDPVKYV